MKKILNKVKQRIFSGHSPRDWDSVYRGANPPWDSGETCPELEKTLREIGGELKSESGVSGLPGEVEVLELGCGTGTNSIYLARQGFKVTGVDISEVALQAARKKAGRQFVNLQFIQAALPDLPLKEGTFNFIFDRGCFHCLRKDVRKDYANMVARFLKKNGKYLLLTGNAREIQNPGPPVLTTEEIKEIFNDRFKIIFIREARFTTVDKPGKGFLAHSCLMQPRT